MAASLKRVFRFSTNLSKCGLLRVSYSLRIGQSAICRTLCSDSKDPDMPDNGTKTKLDLAKPKNRWKEKEERKLEANQAKDIGLDHDLVKAAESVAESLGGDVKQTQSDLLEQLKAHATKAVKEEQEQKPKAGAQSMSMGDLLSSMKFERTTSRRRGAPSKPRAKDSSSDDDETPRRRARFPSATPQREFQQSNFREERVKSMEEIFKGNRLNIFNTDDNVEKKTAVAESPSNPLFDEADAAEFLRLSSAPPANAFEEMIQWTKEGKLWNFPIDNEQGWEEEKNVGFHEHVFLDHLLADFPQTPSIQHFMELVTTGLSMNPYLTVEMKKEHVNWFKEYITSKMHLIDDGDKAVQESQS